MIGIAFEGFGESALLVKTPDETDEPKNRRVDIEFVTYETRTEEVVVPPEPVPGKPPAVTAPAPVAPTVEWRREYIDTEPSWVRRALHNPAQHKQAVDVYRLQNQTTSVTQGEKRFLDRPPVAVNDAFTVAGNSGANALDVLANDSDPDGDPLTIVSVGAGQVDRLSGRAVHRGLRCRRDRGRQAARHGHHGRRQV